MLRRYWRIRTFMLQVVEVPESVRPDVKHTHIIQERDFYRAYKSDNAFLRELASVITLSTSSVPADTRMHGMLGSG